MKKGTKVKLSQFGLNRIYRVNNGVRERAEKKRFEYRGISRDGSAICKRYTSESYVHYHIDFIETAN